MACPDNMGGLCVTGPSPNHICETVISWITTIAQLSQAVATALYDEQLLKDTEAFDQTNNDENDSMCHRHRG